MPNETRLDPQGQRDRVSYSHGYKVPGADQYSSVNVNVSYSTDARDGETAEQALERARAFVLLQCKEAPVPHAPRTPGSRPRVEDELFDEDNPRHQQTALLHFGANNIKTERWRKRLIGEFRGNRVADIPGIVMASVERVKALPPREQNTRGRRGPEDWYS